MSVGVNPKYLKEYLQRVIDQEKANLQQQKALHNKKISKAHEMMKPIFEGLRAFEETTFTSFPIKVLKANGSRQAIVETNRVTIDVQVAENNVNYMVEVSDKEDVFDEQSSKTNIFDNPTSALEYIAQVLGKMIAAKIT